MPRDAVSRTANVGTVGKNGLIKKNSTDGRQVGGAGDDAVLPEHLAGCRARHHKQVDDAGLAHPVCGDLGRDFIIYKKKFIA